MSTEAGELHDPRWATVFCEQQLVHLARLVVVHADRRAPDDFGDGRLYEEWVTCLLAVTDLLDADLVVEDPSSRLAWEIRQCQLNHHAEQLPATALHYEIYSVLWPEVRSEEASDADAAFRRVTGLSIGDFFMVGSAVLARYSNFGHSGAGQPIIRAESYFAPTQLDRAVPSAFLAFVAADIDTLRAEILAEEARFGRTTYGSLTFERHPLVEALPGYFLPTSVASLQRRITEGVFHVLAEAAADEGLDRRHYTSPFGDVFQRSVEDTIRRAESTAPITADILYGPRRRRQRSSDVIIAYERYPVFIEVVSGPLQAATTTRGDLSAFEADLQRLIIGKAKQLSRCIDDFLEGRLPVAEADPAIAHRVWPVIVTSHPFPHAEFILEAIDAALRRERLLQQARTSQVPGRGVRAERSPRR